MSTPTPTTEADAPDLAPAPAAAPRTWTIADLGKPIAGPTALGSDARRFWRLTYALAVTDFRLKFFGSALGYVWQLMHPLAIFSVLLVVFTKLANFGNRSPHYAQSLLLGIVLFTFFTEATGGAVSALVNREALVRKIEFPRLAVPLSVVLGAMFNLGLNLIVVLIFTLAAGIEPRLTWLELPVAVVVLGVLATGVAMILSAAYVRYRDIAPIWSVASTMLFYGSGVFFSYETLKGHKVLLKAVMINPLGSLLQQCRHALIGPSYVSASTALGSWVQLLYPIGITLLIFGLGYVYFDRQAPRIAEDL
jgi:ABC-2 type transport system permease protein